MKPIILIFGVLAALLLSGCQSTNQQAGEGPITLSPSVESRLQTYLANPGSSFFAVSTNGKHHAFSYCADGNVCEEDGGGVALRACRERSQGVPCKIYAVGNRIIWQGAANSGQRIEKVKTDIGSGPLTLFPSAEDLYRQYLEKPNPEYFAVARDGLGAGASFCKNVPCTSPGAKELAIANCLQRYPNAECLIFAIGRKVVWQGKVYSYSKTIPSAATTIERWAGETDTVICRAALDGPQATNWTTNGSYQDAVTEAKKRSLTPSDCRTKT